MSAVNELEKLLSKTYADPDIYSCVMAVESGDGSFQWAGAAGIARDDIQTPMTIETPYFIASITKLFTATVVMKLAEIGKLTLSDPMTDFLPHSLVAGIHVYEDVDYGGEITIENLLAQTSGIADYYFDKPEGGESFFKRVQDEPDRLWTVDETIGLARDELKPKFKPGEQASYSDTNYQILGRIIEAVCQKDLQEVFSELIFYPLDMERTWIFGRSESHRALEGDVADFYFHDQTISRYKGYASSWADGGLVSTVQESLTFLKALNNGKIVDKDKTLPLMHQWRDLQFPLKYGYGTMYFKLPRLMTPFRSVPSIWGHSGSIGSFLFYCEKLDLYMAGTLNQGKSPAKPFNIKVRIMKLFSKSTEDSF